MAANDPIRRNNVQLRGQGPRTLVFGHGLGTDQRAWAAVAAAFEPHFRIVLFDHVGFGGSDAGAYREERHGTLDGYALDLLDILDALGLDDVIYVGHSAGALVGTLASLRAPARFAQLVLLCMSPRFINDPPDYFGGFDALEIEGILDLLDRDQVAWAGTLAPLAIGQEGPPEAARRFAESLSALDPLFARRFARLVFTLDIRHCLPAVSVPVLALHCTQDSIVPPAVGEYLQRALPRVTLQALPATGHCPHISHPAETIAVMAQHLRDAQLGG